MYDNEEYVAEALAVGAAGYVLKDASASEFDLAVHAVARGESYLSPAVAKRIVSGQVPPGGEGAVGLQRQVSQQSAHLVGSEFGHGLPIQGDLVGTQEIE
jgi:DNA-binding NarL/FixJ family response regulator